MKKTCDTCHEEKKTIYFYFDYKNEDNRSSTCMSCVNDRKRANKKNELKKVKEDPRRVFGKKDLVLYKRRSNSRTAQQVYNADPTPMFMQFNHLIYKHVKTKYDLSYSQLNLLLMVAPIVPFPRRDFLSCREIMGYRELGLMKYFIDNDFLYVWKKSMKNDRIPTLYDFTTKGKQLIRDIHNWALGKEPIPEINEDKALDLMARLYQRRRN